MPGSESAGRDPGGGSARRGRLRSLTERANRLPAPLTDRPFLLELFVLSNLAFLTLDVWIAHAVNDFRDPLEWLPVVFAAVGSAVLAAAILGERYPAGGQGSAPDGVGTEAGRAFPREARRRLPRIAALAVAWTAVAVGVGGFLLHLESRFFRELTLESLVYSAPFAAPLAFAGLGLLLLMNRMVPAGSPDWGRWVLLLALGGFAGNFALSLADHAQNGFFHPEEWIAVVASTFAVSFLGMATFFRASRELVRWCAGVLGLQVFVGLLGFWFHLAARFRDDLAFGQDWRQEVIFGAPLFAPLLFVDIALLAALGLWDLRTKTISDA